MPPIIPDSIDCEKLTIAHPACPSTNPVFSDRDGPEGSLVGPPDAGEPGLVVDNGPGWTDPIAGVALEDGTKKLTEGVKDSLPHPASPTLPEQGEVTTMSTNIVTQGMDEVSTDITIVSDPISNHDDHSDDTDWVMVGSMVCIILVMAVLTGE